ncbi:MAG: hypothetical protein RL531_109 [Actinomycetota bacterium]
MRVHEASGLLLPQAVEHRAQVEGRVGAHDEVAGQHDLADRAAADGPERGVHGRVPLVSCRAPDPFDPARDRQGSGAGRSNRRDLRDPGPAGRRAAGDTGGYDERSGFGRVEGECADRDGAGPGLADLVVDGDGGQERLDVLGPDDRGGAVRDEGGAAVGPHEVGRIDGVEQVVVDRHRTGAGDETEFRRGAHARVPVMSCTAPSMSVTRRRSTRPARRSIVSISSGSGRYAVDAGRYR